MYRTQITKSTLENYAKGINNFKSLEQIKFDIFSNETL